MNFRTKKKVFPKNFQSFPSQNKENIFFLVDDDSQKTQLSKKFRKFGHDQFFEEAQLLCSLIFFFAIKFGEKLLEKERKERNLQIISRTNSNSFAPIFSAFEFEGLKCKRKIKLCKFFFSFSFLKISDIFLFRIKIFSEEF